MSHHGRDYYQNCLAAGRLRCGSRRALLEANAAAGPPLASDNLPRRLLKRGLASDLKNTHAELNHFQGESPNGSDSPATGFSTFYDGDVVLRHGDVVLHTVHRHEIPASIGMDGVSPIRLLAVWIHPGEGGLIAVNKPTGLPTHATGRYAFNSVLAMLEYVLSPKRIAAWLWENDPLLQSLVASDDLEKEEKEALWVYYSPRNVKKNPEGGVNPKEINKKEEDEEEDEIAMEKLPRPCHRLDRVTSGILLLGVSEASTSRVSRALMNKSKQAEKVVLEEMANLAHENPLSSTYTKEKERQVIRRMVEEESHGVRKRYIARVSGRFPPDEDVRKGDFSTDISSSGVFRVDEETIGHVNQGILQPLLSHEGETENNAGVTHMVRDVQPDGILFVNPVITNKGFTEANTLDLASSPSLVTSAPVRQNAQTAITLCQRLNFFTRCRFTRKRTPLISKTMKIIVQIIIQRVDQQVFCSASHSQDVCIRFACT
ncbi:unnamed protein product [Phytomonas sp. Hart1]|nr:unnamed protein product [Phytomonas sp. Hart1]|eukprot:CCW70156.1 unnamed protein product [Phytomonas sp. isolate Hart1]